MPTDAMELGTAPSLEQLDELCATDSFREALGRWLAGGAVIWNTWQKYFTAIRARNPERDPEATGPVDVAIATRSQSVWCDLVKVGKKVPRHPQSGAPHLDQSIGALGAMAKKTLPPTSKAGGAPVPSSSWRSGIRWLLGR